MLHILGTIIIGFVAGVIAKLVTPGDNEPKGFILTTILGIVGAFVATYLGQAIGWYGPDQNAGFIGAIVGAVIILLVWGLIQRARRSYSVPGVCDKHETGRRSKGYRYLISSVSSELL
jgi:uncharacterized membrane protein YeaQ/YmgE (transglycosylase-associated protein family)